MGVWVTPESLLPIEIESTSNSPYFKYEFLPEGLVCYASNEFERGECSEFVLKNNQLSMFSWTYTILNYEDGKMELQLDTKWNRHTTTLVKKEKYDSLWKLYAPSEHIKSGQTAIFKGNFHLHEYLFSNFKRPDAYATAQSNIYYYTESALPPPKEDLILKINLIVDYVGNVVVNKVEGIPSIKIRQVDKIRRKLENTSGYWIPAESSGKNVNDTLDLTFVKRGVTSLEIKGKSIQLYYKAYTLFQKGDCFGAVRYASEAITLDGNKFQFYLLRAICYIKMNEIDKYCKDVFKAASLNPYLSLTNVEVVNGEVLEIKCGSN